jgi:HAE1 family hydrophobic/amphiphilic exporter-1
MNLIETSIKRPTFITMVIFAIVVVGMAVLRSIPVDLFPKMDFPIISVTASYPGAAPEEVESLITKNLEDQVSTISGIKSVSSYAAEGVSTVIIEMNMDVPIRKAAEDVREKVAFARRLLPDEVEAPIVQTFDPGAFPVIFYGFSGDSNLALSEYAEDNIKQRLQQIPGVGNVLVFGQQLAEVQVRLDAEKMAAYNAPINSVLGTLRAANMDTPGGRVEQGASQEVLRLTGKFRSLQEIEDTYIALPSGGSVQVKDIAEVAFAQQDGTTRASINGRNGVIVAVAKQSDANTVSVAHAVHKEVEKLGHEMPAGYQLNMVRDQSTFIEESVHELQETILIGAVLAIGIVFFFLRDWRATVIAAIAIPVSIIATFALMAALGFTLNMLTMMALSLSVGLLIDDAIVVVDNVYRHLEMGKSPLEAALEGTKEIQLAVLAVTLTLVAVFVPVGFASGIVGRMMREFAFTVAGAVLVSMFVAFTLTPMMASRFLKRPTVATHHEGANHEAVPVEADAPAGKLTWWDRFNVGWEKQYAKVENTYSAILNWSLKHRWKTLAAAALMFVVSLGSARFIGTEFSPNNDQGMIQINLKAAADSSLDGTQVLAQRLEQQIRAMPEVETVFMTVGNWQNQATNEASMTVRVKPKEVTGLSTAQVEDKIRPLLSQIPGADLKFQVISAMGGGQGSTAPIQLKLRGADLKVLDELSKDLVAKISKIPGTADVRDNLETGKPELRVIPQRDLLNTTGMPESTVMGALRNLVAGEKIGDYSVNGKDREIRLRLQETDRSDVNSIGALTVSGPAGPMVVQDLVTLQKGTGPVIINRDNRTRVVTIESNLRGRSLGEVTKDIDAVLAATKMPNGVTHAYGGQSQQMAESFGSLILMMGLAVIFIYMVLAAQFESFIHPFTIMLSLPLAIVGALLALLLAKQTLSIISIIGIITLMGLVTKNAILLVEFTNQLREEGLPMFEALRKAAPIRLRPILMTTFAMILGMAPMALGVGAGSETRQAMGVAIIGGLITSTVLTLVVVPVVYTMLDRFTLRGGRERKEAKRLAKEQRTAVSVG